MISRDPRDHPVGAALAAALLLQALSARLYSPGIHEYEELYNAAHAALLGAVGVDLLLPLQYQPFCGGCAVDAAMGAASFSALGPSVWAWRLVGLAWFALALAGSVWIARAIAGTAGAVAAAAAFALAPPAYQELANVLNGNHPEAGALLIGILWLSALAIRRTLWWLPLAALVAGFGLYFVRSLALGGVVVGLAWLLADSRWYRKLGILPVVAATAIVGAFPLVAVRLHWGQWPVEPIYQADEWRLSLEWTGRNLRSLLLPVQLRGIWGDGSEGAWSWLGLPAFLGWLGLVGQLLRTRRREAALLVGAMVAFTGLYALFRLSVWMDGDGVPQAQQLRYLGLVYPLALCAAGAGAGALWNRGSRGLVAALGVALLLPGLVTRGQVIASGDWTAAGRRLAPDWCFQAERLRGPLERLERTGAGAPIDLLAFAGGQFVEDEDYFVENTFGEVLPAAPLAGRTAPVDSERAQAAWDRGRALGTMRRLQRADDYDLVALERALADQPTAALAAREALWCHDRPSLSQVGYDEALTEAGPLASVARGFAACRACARGAGQAVEIEWAPGCPGWAPEVDGAGLGWGMGVCLADLRSDELSELTIRAPSSIAPELSAGLKEGLAWGRGNHWLPARLPEVTTLFASPRETNPDDPDQE